jgi:O-antigen ligase
VWAAAAFVLWSALTWVWSVDRGDTLARVSTLAQLLVLLLLVWNFCTTPQRQAQLIAAYVSGSVVVAASTVVRYALGHQTYWKRYAAPGFDPNDAGVTMAIAMPLALYLGLRCHAGWRLAALALTPAILLTGSRTAFIATGIGLGFVLLTWRQSSAWQRGTAGAVAATMALYAFWPSPPHVRQRVTSVTTEITRGTLNTRTTIWKAGFKALRQRPVAGSGAGTYPDAVEPFIGTAPAGHEYVAHNTFLSILVESGVIGAAVFGAFLLLLGLYCWAMPFAERAAWATALIVWVAGVSTLTWEHRKPGWTIFALIISGWALAFRMRAR